MHIAGRSLHMYTLGRYANACQEGAASALDIDALGL